MLWNRSNSISFNAFSICHRTELTHIHTNIIGIHSHTKIGWHISNICIYTLSLIQWATLSYIYSLTFVLSYTILTRKYMHTNDYWETFGRFWKINFINFAYLKRKKRTTFIWGFVCIYNVYMYKEGTITIKKKFNLIAWITFFGLCVFFFVHFILFLPFWTNTKKILI